MGPFTLQSAAENALSLQLFLITVFLPLMFLAALIRERRDKEDALRESEARYRALVMAGANMVWQSECERRGIPGDVAVGSNLRDRARTT